MDDEERTPVDAVLNADEFTPVIPPRVFAADALGHLADSFDGAIRRCREYADVVSDPVRGRVALEELAEYMREHATTSIGVARALERILEAEKNTNGGK